MVIAVDLYQILQFGRPCTASTGAICLVLLFFLRADKAYDKQTPDTSHVSFIAWTHEAHSERAWAELAEQASASAYSAALLDVFPISSRQ